MTDYMRIEPEYSHGYPRFSALIFQFFDIFHVVYRFFANTNCNFSIFGFTCLWGTYNIVIRRSQKNIRISGYQNLQNIRLSSQFWQQIYKLLCLDIGTSSCNLPFFIDLKVCMIQLWFWVYTVHSNTKMGDFDVHKCAYFFQTSPLHIFIGW